MGIFAVYDTTGIQNYIFESNKLSENVGGSRLVEDIFSTLLPETIKSEIKQNLPEWRDAKELDLTQKAEIVYEGGGNAFVVFQSDNIKPQETFGSAIGDQIHFGNEPAKDRAVIKKKKYDRKELKRALENYKYNPKNKKLLDNFLLDYESDLEYYKDFHDIYESIKKKYC